MADSQPSWLATLLGVSRQYIVTKVRLSQVQSDTWSFTVSQEFYSYKLTRRNPWQFESKVRAKGTLIILPTFDSTIVSFAAKVDLNTFHTTQALFVTLFVAISGLVLKNSPPELLIILIITLSLLFVVTGYRMNLNGKNYMSALVKDLQHTLER